MNKNLFYVFLLLLIIFATSCSSAKIESSSAQSESNVIEPSTEAQKLAQEAAFRNEGSEIEIEKDSPADTVRVFYARLREQKFRDAIILTNLRPAVEGLTDAELGALSVDFVALAKNIPAVIPINGEIIAGDDATVTVKLPNDETQKVELQEVKLKKEDDRWIVQLADKKGEARARKEGKNYFFALRMDVHHMEARAMLDRIGKAQLVYSMKNGGKFASLDSLIQKGFVPEDAVDASSTGYEYDVKLAPDSSTYTALATPATYGRSGKLSFALKITKTAEPELIKKDLAGKPILN